MAGLIRAGDIVSVNFHGSQFTLSARAVVRYMPCATGDSWVFDCLIDGRTHYISEPCTVSLIEKAANNQQEEG